MCKKKGWKPWNVIPEFCRIPGSFSSREDKEMKLPFQMMWALFFSFRSKSLALLLRGHQLIFPAGGILSYVSCIHSNLLVWTALQYRQFPLHRQNSHTSPSKKPSIIRTLSKLYGQRTQISALGSKFIQTNLFIMDTLGTRCR